MLDTLSTELLEHNSSFLDGPELSSLGLVCQSLRESTTAVFGGAWLRVVDTDLSKESLPSLVTIAHHDIFRNSVRTLRVAREGKRLYGTLGGEHIWPRRASSALDFSSAVVRNFQDMVRRLDNCTTVEVCDRPGSYYGDSEA